VVRLLILAKTQPISAHVHLKCMFFILKNQTKTKLKLTTGGAPRKVQTALQSWTFKYFGPQIFLIIFYLGVQIVSQRSPGDVNSNHQSTSTSPAHSIRKQTCCLHPLVILFFFVFIYKLNRKLLFYKKFHFSIKGPFLRWESNLYLIGKTFLIAQFFPFFLLFFLIANLFFYFLICDCIWKLLIMSFFFACSISTLFINPF
jgi:hypothetical protein